MKRNFYALLVGIDQYPEPQAPLAGCGNDVRAFARFLEARTDAPERLFLRTLTDAEATRKNVITTFRRHLGQAERGDTALFFFAGHGSQERTPPLYAASETDRLDETVVAWDSRRPGRWDLSGRELSVLVAEVARREVHVVVILDSCHSGTATRSVDRAERRLAADLRHRPAESLWFFGKDDVPRDLDAAGGWRLLPQGPHVFFAACRDFEQCQEKGMDDGLRHGLFSYELLETLKRLGPGATYRDLHKEVQIRVNNANPHQWPEAAGDLDLRIFDGALVPRRAVYHVRRHVQGDLAEWRLDAGAVHGIRFGSELAVLPPEARKSDERLATARVTRVEMAESEIEVLDGHLPYGAWTLRAVLTRSEAAPLSVALDPELARGGLAEALSASPLLHLTERKEDADFVVEARHGRHELRRAGACGVLLAPDPRRDGDDDSGAVRHSRTVEALEHVARWQNIANLRNPASPLRGAVEMTLWEWTGPPTAENPEPQVDPLPAQEEVRLLYRTPGKRGTPGRFTVRLHNRTQRWLYFALFGLDENFAVHGIRGARGRLRPGHRFWVRPADGIPASVPENLYDLGITQRRDLLMLVLGEADADWSLMEQGRLGLPYQRHQPETGRPRGPWPPGLAACFLPPREVTRETVDLSQALVESRWAVERRALVAERPALLRELDGRGTVRLADGVRLTAPEGFRATVQLHNGPAAAWRRGRPWRPALRSGLGLRPAALAMRLGSDSGLWALEIRGARAARVEPEAPLHLESEAVPEGEALIAIADDGRGGLLAGDAEEVAPGEPARCRIVALPESAAGAGVWLFFYLLERGKYASTPLRQLLGRGVGSPGHPR